MIDKQIGTTIDITDNIITTINSDDKELPIWYTLFYDLEWDDTEGLPNPKKQRILSISTVDYKGEKRQWCDNDENKMLTDFWEYARQYEPLVSWSPYNDEYDPIDFTFLKVRFRENKINADLRETQFLDLGYLYMLRCRSLKVNLPSWSLEYVADYEKLSERKVKMTMGFLEAFHKDRALLLWRNLSDAMILKEINDKYQIIELRGRIADIAGVFIENTSYYSTPVEMLVYRKTKELGKKVIYPNRRKVKQPKSKYRGAIVIEPIVGVHKQLVFFDFLSLYNRVMQEYNLSPELYREFMLSNKFNDKEDLQLQLMNFCKSQPKAIVPQILEELEKERNKYKKLRDSFVKDSTQ